MIARDWKLECPRGNWPLAVTTDPHLPHVRTRGNITRARLSPRAPVSINRSVCLKSGRNRLHDRLLAMAAMGRNSTASERLTTMAQSRRFRPATAGADRNADSPLEGAGFEPVWGFSCQAVVLGCADSFLFGAGKAVFRPVACDQVRGARGRGQGTETGAKLGGLPPSNACVSQRLDA